MECCVVVIVPLCPALPLWCTLAMKVKWPLISLTQESRRKESGNGFWTQWRVASVSLPPPGDNIRPPPLLVQGDNSGRFVMFCYPALAVGSYICGPPAAGTTSKEGFKPTRMVILYSYS